MLGYTKRLDSCSSMRVCVVRELRDDPEYDALKLKHVFGISDLGVKKKNRRTSKLCELTCSSRVCTDHGLNLLELD